MGKSLLLRGENGTGKSSLAEAFEFFFTGGLSVFEGKGTQSLSLQKHMPHKNFDKDNVVVAVTFDPGSIALERTFSDQPAPPKQLEDYFQAARRGTFILRRAQILKFVVSVPADRFRAIASILGIERLDNVELEMKRAYEELDGAVCSKRDGIKDTFEQISTLLRKRTTNAKQALDFVNKSLKKAKMTTLRSFDDVDNIEDEMLKTFKKSADFEHVTKLNDVLGKLKLLRVDDEIAGNLHALNKKIGPFLEGNARSELSLTEFLVKGLEAVKDDEKDACPLCGQDVSRQELLKQINERLKTLSQLSDEASEVRQISTETEEKLSSLAGKIEEISEELEPLDELKNKRKKLLGISKSLKKLAGEVNSAGELEGKVPTKAFDQEMTKLEKLVKASAEKCQAMLEKIGVPKDWKSKVQTVSLINQVKSLVGEVAKAKESLKTKEKHSALSKKVYQTFSKVKKAKIKEIYDSITGNVNAFYSMLHPKDAHKNIELNIASGRRASAELKMESFGSKEDPRAFASEGHLDSLGLCIFLAFAKRFNGPCNFIVLDDVVTTIDAQHRGRICKLLSQHFKDYQLLITTHDAVWFEQLCAHQRAFGIDGSFRNMEIVGWTLETGPIIEPYKTRWDRIEARIKSGDKSGAANEARRYLEWVLRKICVAAMARPILKEGRYTVSDLLTPAKERIKKLIKDNDFRERVLKGFQELEATVIMGNLLSHDNPEAENTSTVEVNRFCEAVHELNNTFTCPDCGTLFKYYQDMKRIRCPNSRCKQQIDIACK